MSDRPLTLEFCAENMTLVPAAIAAGADRIELCDNLAVGGTTPSIGTVEACVRYAHERGVRVMVIIRPRGGDFVYARGELDAMEADICLACEMGADGIVLGCLEPRDPELYRRARRDALLAGACPGNGPLPYTGAFDLDVAATERLASLALEAGATDVTFHMAFDELDDADQERALPVLARLGVTRVLTHGSGAGTPIEDNLSHLRRLVGLSGGNPIILPGGDITYRNARAVAEALSVREVHGTRIIDLSLADHSTAEAPTR